MVKYARGRDSFYHKNWAVEALNSNFTIQGLKRKRKKNTKK